MAEGEEGGDDTDVSMDDIEDLLAETDAVVNEAKEIQGSEADTSEEHTIKAKPKTATSKPEPRVATSNDNTNIKPEVSKDENPANASHEKGAAATTVKAPETGKDKKPVITPEMMKPRVDPTSKPTSSQDDFYFSPEPPKRFARTKAMYSAITTAGGNLKNYVSNFKIRIPNIKIPSVNISMPNIDISKAKSYLPSRGPTKKEALVGGAIITAGVSGVGLAMYSGEISDIANRIFFSQPQVTISEPLVADNGTQKGPAETSNYGSQGAADLAAKSGLTFIIERPKKTGTISESPLNMSRPKGEESDRSLDFTLAPTPVQEPVKGDSIDAVVEDAPVIKAEPAAKTAKTKAAAAAVKADDGPSKAVLEYRTNLSNAESTYNTALTAYTNFTRDNQNPTNALRTAQANYSRLEKQLQTAKTALSNIQPNPEYHKSVTGETFISIAEKYIKQGGCNDCDPIIIAGLIAQDNFGTTVPVETLSTEIAPDSQVIIGQAGLYLFGNTDYESQRNDAQTKVKSVAAELAKAKGILDAARKSSQSYRTNEARLRGARDTAQSAYQTLKNNPVN